VAAELIMAPATPKKWRLLMFIFNPLVPWLSGKFDNLYEEMASVPYIVQVSLISRFANIYFLARPDCKSPTWR
jgi:hypothetical protein